MLPDSANALRKLLDRTGLKQVDITNRAIPAFEFLDAAQRAGDRVVVHHADGTETRIVIR